MDSVSHNMENLANAMLQTENRTLSFRQQATECQEIASLLVSMGSLLATFSKSSEPAPAVTKKSFAFKSQHTTTDEVKAFHFKYLRSKTSISVGDHVFYSYSNPETQLFHSVCKFTMRGIALGACVSIWMKPEESFRVCELLSGHYKLDVPALQASYSIEFLSNTFYHKVMPILW